QRSPATGGGGRLGERATQRGPRRDPRARQPRRRPVRGRARRRGRPAGRDRQRDPPADGRREPNGTSRIERRLEQPRWLAVAVPSGSIVLALLLTGAVLL